MNKITHWRGELVETPIAVAEHERIRATSFDSPDLSKIFHSLYSNFPLIAGVAVAGALAAFLILKSITPQFSATTLIMLDSRNTILDETTSVFASLPIADTYFESEIELIRSDAIVKRVIEEMGLANDPEFSRGEPPPGIRQLAAERAASDGAENKAVKSEDLLTSVKTFQVAQEIRKRLGVQRRGMSQGIVISFRSRSQVKARDIADAFAQTYVLDQLNNKMDATRRASTWLEAELSDLGRETQIAERTVEVYREEHALVGEGDQGVSAQRLRSLTADLATAKAAQSQAKVTLDHIRSLEKAGKSPMLAPEISGKKSIETLSAKLSEADLTKMELMERYNIDNIDNIPPLREAVARSNVISSSLDAEVSAAVREIEAKAEAATALVERSERELALFRDQNASVNTAMIGLNELEREAEGKRRRYDALLVEYNKADNSAAAQTPHARIVSPAELPLTPSAPRKKPAFAAAVVFSGALGIFAALLRDFLRNNIRTPEEFRAATNLRAISATPRLKTRKNQIARTMNIVGKDPESAFSQAVRSIRTELWLGGHHSETMVIAVTSPGKNSSKAALAAGLARSMAQSKIQTLLVDADLRHPEIMPALYRNHTGADLSAVMAGEAPWRSGIVSSKNLPMDIIGAHDRTIENCAHFAFEDRFNDLLAEWRESYQAIIINTAPGLAFSDVRAITMRADQIILCAEWNVADRRQVAEAVELIYETNDAPMAVITNVPTRNFRRMTRDRFDDAVGTFRPRSLQI